MRPLNRTLQIMLFILPVLVASSSWGQTQTKETEKKPAAATPDAATQDKNINEYIQLMREDVRQQKSELMGAVMLLSAADAAKFSPIYSVYDAELTKLNDQRVAN